MSWIPLLLLTLLFVSSSLRAQREQIIDGNIKLFESSINNYEFIFTNFFVSAGDLLYLPEAHQLALDPSPLDEREELVALQLEMQRITSRFDMISGVSLFLSEERLFLSAAGFQNTAAFQQQNPTAHRVLLNLPGYQNIWIPQHRVDSGFRTMAVVHYVMPLRSKRERPYGAFLYTFPVDSLLNLLAIQQSDTYFFVSDAPGSILFGNRDLNFLTDLARDFDVARLLREQSPQTRFYSGESRFVLHKSSPVTDLSYVSVFPENPLNEELQLSPTIALLAAVVLILSLFLTILFSNYIAQPIAEVISAIDVDISNQREGDGSRWSAIFNRLHHVGLSEEVSVGRLISDHRSILEATLAGVLLRDRPLSRDQQSVLEESGLTGPLYAACFVALQETRVAQLDDLIFGIEGQARGGMEVCAFALDNASVGVVVSGTSASVRSRSVVVFAARVVELIANRGTTATVGVGPVVSSAEQFSDSFASARLAGRSGIPGEVVESSSLRQEEAGYPFDRVRQFLQALRDANQSLSVQRLQEIIGIIREQTRGCPPAHARNMYHLFYHDIERESYELAAPIDSAHHARLRSLFNAAVLDHDAVAAALDATVKDITGTLEAQPGSDPSQAIDRVAQFIRENYRRDIPLDELAGVAGLTSQYLSTLFRKRKGTTIVSYITSLRMEAARALLRDTGKSVQEIASEVGYANPQYFTRVFKRAVGATPLQYRKAQRSSGRPSGV